MFLAIIKKRKEKGNIKYTMKERTFESPFDVTRHVISNDCGTGRMLIMFIPYYTEGQITFSGNFVRNCDSICRVVIMLGFKSDSFSLLHVENCRRQTFDFH